MQSKKKMSIHCANEQIEGFNKIDVISKKYNDVYMFHSS